MEEKRPQGIPPEATWSASDNEWVLLPKDDENRNHGICTYWRPDGTLVNHCQFEQGAPHGWYKRYHQSGEVSREGTFVSGKLHGTDVYTRSDKPSTETFPAGLGDRVWRAEMDMCENRIVAGRCYDREGLQVAETGEAFPESPASVPEEATFSATGGRWLVGRTDDQFEHHGLWRFYTREGALNQETEFDHGSEVWTRHYNSIDEALAEVALREGDLETAAGAARRLWASEGPDAVTVGGSLLLRILPALDKPDRKEMLAVALAIREKTRSHIQSPFTPSGIRNNLVFGTACEFLAQDELDHGDGSGLDAALKLIDEALDANFHYGTASLRVTKTGILRRLGRDDEAFQIARAQLATDPDTPGLEELAQSPDFADWMKSIRTDSMTVDGAFEIMGTRGEKLLELVAPILREVQDQERQEEDNEEEENGEDGETCHDVPWDLASSLGERLSPELLAYAKMDIAKRIQNTYRGLFLAPSNTSVSSAVAARDGTWIARLQSCFLPVSALLVENEAFWVAGWQAGRHGTSRVYTQHQDEPEFDQSSASIAAFLTDRILKDTEFEKIPLPALTRERWTKADLLCLKADDEVFAPHLDVYFMEPRTRWIVGHLLGISLGKGLGSAATMENWAQERDLVGDWPHLQAYWLFHHLVFDNQEELAWLCEVADRRHPAVDELATIANDALTGKPVDASFWDETQTLGLRARALDEGHEKLFGEGALGRLQETLAERREAESRVAAAKAELEASGDPKVSAVFEIWSLLEDTAGRLEVFEQHILEQVFPDQDEATDYMMRQRSGHASILARVIFGLFGKVDAKWLAFFEASVKRGAAFDEEHASSVPGALFGLGLAMNDFDAFMNFVKSMSFHPDEFGRRRRLETTLLALHLWDQGEGPQQFLLGEAERYAAQFHNWQVDTTATALFSLIEKEVPRAAEIFCEMFARVSFSGANWTTALLFVGECAKRKNPSLAPGLLAAVDKGLGRHDDGDRAEVIQAYASCAGKAAIKELENRLENIDDVRTDCERAALLSGLIQTEPDSETYAKDAAATIGRMLEGRVDSMRFGASVSLLKVLHNAGLKGFAELAASVHERGKTDEYAKEKLKTWLEESLASFV
ncbi:MAG: hypothetical protein JRF33_18275 [Deltaproteobacteria bacterium]|nr:hypothetical protein [Deltaproteobacteria bacterium]